MLSRWTRRAARLFDVRLAEESTESLSPEEDEFLSVDFEAIRSHLVSVPDLSRRTVAQLNARFISPVCKTIQDMIAEDVSCVARLLSELEPLSVPDPEANVPTKGRPQMSLSRSDIILDAPPDPRPSKLGVMHPVRKRRRSSLRQEVIFMSTTPSIPSVVVTLCADQPRETSCCVPLQDRAFGRRLSLPAHPAFNHAHPPRFPLHKNHAPLAYVDRWLYEGGRWRAVLPSLEEQERRGIYSRGFVHRRRVKMPPRPGCDPR